MALRMCTAWFLPILFVFATFHEMSTVAVSTEPQARTDTSRLVTSPATTIARTHSTGSVSSTLASAVASSSTKHSESTLPNTTPGSSEHPKESSLTVSTTESLTSPNSSSSTITLTTTGLLHTSTNNSFVNETTHLTSLSTVIALTTNSSVTSVHGNIMSTTGGQNSTDLARNPGLVAVLCIFFIVLALLLVVAIAKAISSKRPRFEKLDDVPMNKMNEESPFALYPPK